MKFQSIKRNKIYALLPLTLIVLNPSVCFPHCFINKFTNNSQQYEAQENPHCDQQETLGGYKPEMVMNRNDYGSVTCIHILNYEQMRQICAPAFS